MDTSKRQVKKLISNILKELEIDFDIKSEKNIDSFFFTTGMEIGTVRGFIAVNYEEHQIIIHIGYPTNIPDYKRRIVSELIARINYDDLFGSFVIDINDGFLGYQCGFLTVKDIKTVEKHIWKHFNSSCERLKYYFPVILKVAFGDKEPAQVLVELEHQMDPRLN